MAPLKPLHIHGNFNPTCNDPAIRLSYETHLDDYFGHLVLGTPENSDGLNLGQYSFIARAKDLILQADASAEDLILTTRNNSGNIRFSTTQDLLGPDFERMTITPEGRVGIFNPIPKNLFSTKETIGLDFYSDDIHYQDIRFNCFADSEYRDGDTRSDTSSRDDRDQLYHKNILPGHSSIIQSMSATYNGGLLIAVTQNNEQPESLIDFFEGPQPKGIKLQNYQSTPEINVTNIGLGSLTESDTRVIIRGRTSDNTMNALKIVNWNNQALFIVRNDGYISFGPEIYDIALPPEFDRRLSVDGQIVAKDIIVTLSDWSDFVFEDGYNLQSLEEVEQFIKDNKHLPKIPSAMDVESNGINVGDMQAKLLQKIEELTLYMIQMKKENDELKNRINKLENKY